MTMAKFLRLLLFVLVGGIIYLFFVREDMPFAQLANKSRDGSDFVSRDNDARRGDDPTYSQEVRQNAAIVLETQRKQMELEQQLANEREQAARSQQDLVQKLGEVTRELSQLRETQGKVDEDHGAAVQQEVDARMEKINETLATLQQQQAENQAASQARISELEQQLASAQAANAASSAPDAIDALKQPGQTTTPPLPDVYGSGSITLPYQGMGSGESTSVSRVPRAPVASGSNSGSGDILDTLQRTLTGVVPDRDPNVPRYNLPQPGERRQQDGWETVFPVYTLPPNAVLSNALLVTPIIGRVPLPNRNGRVEDPFFFKVEIGGANLAANGHQIPGVAKMIASGYATGIRDQQCVRGYIDSLTFIFIDGRIVNQGKASGEGASSGDVLGYLSDPWGKPCIRGRYINNADSYLRSRGTAAFIEAAAEALSQGQVNYKQNSDGNYSAALSGDVWKFVFGRGVSGTAAEFAQYVKERTADTFDVVYVEQGKPVQIMLDKMIPIDYDAKARKVNYYREPKIKRRYD
jgi:hypothetical protein